MLAARGLVVTALLAVCFDSFVRWPMVRAEDDASAPVVEADTETAEASPAEEGGEGGEETEDAKGQQFVDSAKELQEKLGQLKALLDAKGESADPALKEKLSGLEDQLKGLGLDGLSGGGTGSNAALTEFLSGCMVLAMRKTGIQRPATIGALRKLADNKLSPADAAKMDLWRMIGVCVSDFTEEEYASYKAGKMKVLPKAYVEASKTPEAEQKVLAIEAAHWEELRNIAAGLLKELVGDTQGSKPPVMYGLLAMVPLAVMGAFMFKLYRDMKKREEEKEEKAAKKEKKKSK